MAIKIEGGLTVAGNVVGFTAAGETVCMRRLAKQAAYRVYVGDGCAVLTDLRSRIFKNSASAREYAASLVDEATTLEKAWWPVKTV